MTDETGRTGPELAGYMELQFVNLAYHPQGNLGSLASDETSGQFSYHHEGTNKPEYEAFYNVMAMHLGFAVRKALDVAPESVSRVRIRVETIDVTDQARSN